MRTVIPEGLAIVNKWPQMVVTGKRLSARRAKDIIFRTDTSLTSFSEYSWGNNHEWQSWAMKTLGFDLLKDKDGKTEWDVVNEVREKLGIVRTDYVHNTWAASAFIGGPHGWCHPDGKILFTDNIGKWPNLSKVIEDWEKLQDAFPYIDVAGTLMDKESSEDDRQPIISFLVKKGKIEFTTDHDGIHPEFEKEDPMETLIANWGSPNREQGLPDSWIVELGKKTKPLIEAAMNK